MASLDYSKWDNINTDSESEEEGDKDNQKSGIIPTSQAQSYEKTDAEDCRHGGPPGRVIMQYVPHIETMLHMLNQGWPQDQSCLRLINYVRRNPSLMQGTVLQALRAMTIDPFLDGQLHIFSRYFIIVSIVEGCAQMFRRNPQRFLAGRIDNDILEVIGEGYSRPIHAQVASLADWSTCNCLKRRVCRHCKKVCVHHINVNTFGIFADSEAEFHSNSLSEKLFRCSRCNQAWYCSRKCQRKNWKSHKSECRPLQSSTV